MAIKVKVKDLSVTLSMQSPQNLRKFLMKQVPGFLYRKPMNLIHCRGFGTCGTCAVEVEGEMTPPTAMEKWRLNFPPHDDGLSRGLRLACQCKPLGDIKLLKPSGLWGHEGGNS